MSGTSVKRHRYWVVGVVEPKKGEDGTVRRLMVIGPSSKGEALTTAVDAHRKTLVGAERRKHFTAMVLFDHEVRYYAKEFMDRFSAHLSALGDGE